MAVKLSPKIIVIAGAHSNVGKTTLAYQLCDVLNNSVRVKIGHHQEKEDGDRNYYSGAEFSDILTDHGNCAYLIIESNRILNEIKPDCLIFLTGRGEMKPSAAFALRSADIVRGKSIDISRQKSIAKSLDINMTAVRKIVELSGGHTV